MKKDKNLMFIIKFLLTKNHLPSIMRIEGGWFEWKEVYIPCKKALRFFARFF